MKIGNIELGERPLALAPMESVTDLPFRLFCKRFGADILYTEFTNCEALVRNVTRSLERIRIVEEERPVGVQIYGSGEASMERAAEMATEAKPDFVDINCGCWVKKIAMRGDGAGLLRDLTKFEAVIRAVVRSTPLPVTVKTRLGWDANSICILDAARIAEQAGAKALSVHCRTRSQAYKGEADWSWLEKIKQVISIPLIGNGDVQTPEDARRMFETGCDAVMIGRGAIRDPWIFAHIKHYFATGEMLSLPSLTDRVQFCMDLLKTEAESKGELRAVREHRKLYASYLRDAPGIAKLRASLMPLETIAEVEARLAQFMNETQPENAT